MATLKPTFTVALLSRAMLVGALILFSNPSESNAQIGSHRGGLFQLGNGQGVRIGGPRVGMQFGGGQGTSIGGQNFGMRFGNGQGARFGGQNDGMQFGGGPGTQFGRLNTNTGGVPGTNYYGDVRGRYQPAAPAARSTSRQSTYHPPRQPAAVVRPNVTGLSTARSVNPIPLTNRYRPPARAFAAGIDFAGDNVRLDSQVHPASAGISILPGQYDIARQATVAPRAAVPAVNSDGSVSLRFPAHVDAPFAYQLNGDQYSIGKNQTVTLARSDQYNVRFSGGAGVGDRIATLEAGKSYAFDLRKKEGWVLIPDFPSVPVSNVPPQATASLEETLSTEETAEANEEVGNSILEFED